MTQPRRTFLRLAPLALAPAAQAAPLPSTFPSQPPELAREMVGVSHGNVVRVRELLKLHPTLAKAAWDWGFGDWETALGAASHTGNREIAQILLDHGAHPTIFSAAMLGQLDVVKAHIAAHPGIQGFAGPHSISLLAHAAAGKEKAKPVYEYLVSLSNADQPGEHPLTAAELETITGAYAFGPNPADRFEINTNNSRKQLRFIYNGSSGHRLIHKGNLVFHPAGAPAVRVVFEGGKRVTVHDPEPILVANRL